MEILNEGQKVTIETPLTVDGQTVIKEVEYTVRRLNTKDVFTFVNILSKVGSRFMGQMVAMTANAKEEKKVTEQEKAEMSEEELTALEEYNKKVREEAEERNKQIGFKLFGMLPVIQDELETFFSSLIGVDREKFESLGLDAIPKIVGALMESSDLKRFFVTAKGIWEKFGVK